MRFFICAMIALSVLAGTIAVPASALDAKQFWDQYDRDHGSGGSGG